MQPFAEWFVQLIEMVQNVGVAVAAGITARTAVLALHTWRAELRGKTQYTVSQRLYLLARDFEHQMALAQKAPTGQLEWQQRLATPGEREETFDIRNDQFAYVNRAERMKELLQKLREASWEADLVLGLDGTTLIRPFEEAEKAFSDSVFLYFNDRILRAVHAERSLLLTIENVREHGYNVKGVDGNEVSAKVTGGIAALKQALHPYVA
jgi:hypothetical protein